MVDEEVLMKALKDLREAMNMTQNAFAVRIKKSYQSIQRYEQVKPPRGTDLVKFVKLARDYKRLDLAKIFKAAAVESIPDELMRLVRDRGPEDDYTPGKETNQQGSVNQRKVRS